MDTDLQGFIARLSATRSTEQSWDETISFQKSIGFDLVMYGYVTGESKPDILTMSNFPGDYQLRYRRERYDRDDALVRHCFDSMSPMTVGALALPRWPDGGRSLSPIQRRIIDEAGECGMKVGFVVPLRSPGRHPVAGMSMANAMRLAEFERFMSSWGRVAHLAALYAHTRIQMQLKSEETTVRNVDLSARERDGLLWTARGMSSKETARKMGISAKTVDFHIANAMRKLNAATRCQAVAVAVTAGLLEP